MRGTFTGWFGFIIIIVSAVLAAMGAVGGESWTEAVHENAANMAMGVAFMAWSAADKAKELAERGKDKVP